MKDASPDGVMKSPCTHSDLTMVPFQIVRLRDGIELCHVAGLQLTRYAHQHLSGVVMAHVPICGLQSVSQWFQSSNSSPSFLLNVRPVGCAPTGRVEEKPKRKKSIKSSARSTRTWAPCLSPRA